MLNGFSPLPNNELQRICLNKGLSEKRAQTIGRHIQEYFSPIIMQSDVKILLDVKMYGYGEKIPDGVENPKQQDPRRRICKVYAYVSPSFDWNKLFLMKQK